MHPQNAPTQPKTKEGSRKQTVYEALISLKWAVIGLSMVLSLRYLVWRGTDTLNFKTPLHAAVSLLLYAAEIYGFVSIALFFLQAREPVENRPVPVPEPELPTVDVFVTIYNEPASILYRTLLCCKALDYPAELLKVYVLDDGPRAAIRALAEKLGCDYLTREDRKHAKAGNINNALKHSSGELVLVLDCDHVPVRSLLRETVGFLKDPKVAFVQLPHHFYNPDTFQHNLHLDNELVHEQDLFFQVIQPGRQRTNSVMFCGSNTLMRRSALDAVGGVQTACAIEDTHTSMRLQAKGYKAVFYNKVLAGGLSPESFEGYLTQRKRWTRGGVQLFVLDNPLLRLGLNLTQRLSYFSSILYFFHGWARLVYLLAPLAFLIGSVDPIVSGTWTLVCYFLPHYVAGHIAFLVVSREFRNPFWSDVYEAASAFSLSWTALQALLHPEKLIFNVTPKGEVSTRPHQIHWSYVLPHAAVMGLLILGLIVATNRMNSSGIYLDAYALSFVWAAFNLILLGCAIEGARERPQIRSEYRLNRRIPCELGYHGKVFEGTVLNICESGMLVRLKTEEHMPPIVRARILGEDGVTELDGEVMHQDLPRGGGTNVGMRFTDVTAELRHDLVHRIFGSPGSWEEHTRPFVSSWTAFWHIATSAVRPRLRKQKRQRRARARIRVQVPCEVAANGQSLPATIQDLSATGARFSLAGDAPLPQEVTLRLRLKSGPVLVRSRTVRRAQGNGRPTEYGIRFLSPSHLDPGALEDMEEAASG